MTFSIGYRRKIQKFIERLPADTKERLRKSIQSLAENPFPQGVVRVEGYKDYKVFRICIGDFRILYLVDYTEKFITIINIDKRSKVYD